MATASVIWPEMEHCLVCGNPQYEMHHIFGGTANRRISDRYGYVVPLCRGCHTGTHGVHFNRAFDLALKQTAQEHFEANYGDSEAFIRTFGKSYK